MADSTDIIIGLYQNNVARNATNKDLYAVGNVLNSDIKEIEAILKTTGTTGYKLFNYDVEGNITSQEIYSDTAGLNLAFTVTYDYTGDDLTLMTIERESDGFTYTKTLAYDVDGNLESITIEQI